MTRAALLLAVLSNAAPGQDRFRLITDLRGDSPEAAEAAALRLASLGEEGRLALEEELDILVRRNSGGLSAELPELAALDWELRIRDERVGVFAVLALLRVGSRASMGPLRRLREAYAGRVGRAAAFVADWIDWTPTRRDEEAGDDVAHVGGPIDVGRLQHGRGTARLEHWHPTLDSTSHHLEFDVDDLLTARRFDLRERRFRWFAWDGIESVPAESWSGEAWHLSFGSWGPRFAGRSAHYEGPCIGAFDLGGAGHLLVPPADYSQGVPRDLEAHFVRLMSRSQSQGSRQVDDALPGWIVLVGRDADGRFVFRWKAVLRCDSPSGFRSFWTRGEVRLDPSSSRAVEHHHAGLWSAGARGDGERYIESRYEAME